MNARAKKYSKILYFPDARMQALAQKVVETKDATSNKKKLDKHYPYNCVSKWYPMAGLTPRNERVEFVLPCGFKLGETWGALRKAWKGYKRALTDDDEVLMREYATRIQKLEEELGVPTASFPNLGLLGDIFFLYNKDKELELRQKYMNENVICDRYNVENVEQLIAEGKAIAFDSPKELKNYKRYQHYDHMNQVMMDWINSDATQEFVKVQQRKWNRRSQIKMEINAIKDELKAMRKGQGQKGWSKLKADEKTKFSNRRRGLLQQKILKESELHAVETIRLTRTDQGWKYVKEILEDNKRNIIKYDYEPQFHLVDLNGRRLAEYKHEFNPENKFLKNPYVYRLYLEDMEWLKIYRHEGAPMPIVNED